MSAAAAGRLQRQRERLQRQSRLRVQLCPPLTVGEQRLHAQKVADGRNPRHPQPVILHRLLLPLPPDLLAVGP